MIPAAAAIEPRVDFGVRPPAVLGGVPLAPLSRGVVLARGELDTPPPAFFVLPAFPGTAREDTGAGAGAAAAGAGAGAIVTVTEPPRIAGAGAGARTGVDPDGAGTEMGITGVVVISVLPPVGGVGETLAFDILPKCVVVGQPYDRIRSMPHEGTQHVRTRCTGWKMRLSAINEIWEAARR